MITEWTLGLTGLLIVTIVPLFLWRIWRTGQVMEDRLSSACQSAADARRSAQELQRILDTIRKSKESNS